MPRQAEIDRPKSRSEAEHSSLRKNSFWMLSGQSLSMGFQALYFVLIGRALGSRQYGLFVGVASLIGVLGQFSCVGMELILIRDVSRNRQSFRSSWGLALQLSCIGFVLVTLISIAIGRVALPSEMRILIPFIALSDVLFAKISLLSSKAFQAVGKFRESANLMVLTNLARAMFAAWLFFAALHYGVQQTALAWTRIYWISSSIVAAIAFGMVSQQIGLPQFRRIKWTTLSEGLSFSLSSSSISIYNDIDKTLLSSYGQLAAAGIYAAAYRIVDVASTPVYSVYAAAFPQFFREGAKGIRTASAFAKRLLRKTVAYAMLAALIMYLGAFALPYVLGRSFAPSAEALRWLCLLPLIRCFHYAAGTTITGSASQWYRTIQQIFVALLNVLLNVVLIPKYSWRGAAIASLITDSTLAILNFLCVRWLVIQQDKRAIDAC